VSSGTVYVNSRVDFLKRKIFLPQIINKIHSGQLVKQRNLNDFLSLSPFSPIKLYISWHFVVNFSRGYASGSFPWSSRKHNLGFDCFLRFLFKKANCTVRTVKFSTIYISWHFVLICSWSLHYRFCFPLKVKKTQSGLIHFSFLLRFLD
jgi:hypothetical protein